MTDQNTKENHLRSQLIAEMKKVFKEDSKRIEHALAVLNSAQQIRLVEGGDPLIIQAAAILHDIGILEAQRKYGSSAGKYQEIEGPPIAEKILKALLIAPDAIEHICKIIDSHHSGGDIDTQEFKIVWDADLLINLGEQLAGMDRKELRDFVDKRFRTKNGKEIAMKLVVGDDI